MHVRSSSGSAEGLLFAQLRLLLGGVHTPILRVRHKVRGAPLSLVFQCLALPPSPLKSLDIPLAFAPSSTADMGFWALLRVGLAGFQANYGLSFSRNRVASASSCHLTRCSGVLIAGNLRETIKARSSSHGRPGRRSDDESPPPLSLRHRLPLRRRRLHQLHPDPWKGLALHLALHLSHFLFFSSLI